MKPIPITVERYEARWTWQTWAWLAATVLSFLAFCFCVAFMAGAIFQRYFS